MSEYVTNLFKKEMIETKPKGDILEILPYVGEDYLKVLCRTYELDVEKNIDTLHEELKTSITSEFSKRIMAEDPKFIKAFNDLYNGVVDYSDENLYIYFKEFSWRGWLFLFSNNRGKLFNYRIPDELCRIFEELLRTS